MDEEHLRGAFGQIAVDESRELAFATGYNSNSLVVYSYEDTANPVLVGSVVSATDLNGARGVSFDAESGVGLVTAWGSSSLVVISVSDTRNMAILGKVESSAYMSRAYGSCLDTESSMAYIINYDSRKFAAVSYANPAAPFIIGNFEGDATCVARPFFVYASWFAFLAHFYRLSFLSTYLSLFFSSFLPFFPHALRRSQLHGWSAEYCM